MDEPNGCIYKCIKCGEPLQSTNPAIGELRCNKCFSRIFYKERPHTTKTNVSTD